MTTRATISAVGVVVPVHNEEALLGACLGALTRAVAAVPAHVAVEVAVVLDACADGSAEIAERAGFPTIAVEGRCVGRARQVGVEAVLQQLTDHPPEAVWLAHTDADSVVPAHWLTHQLDLAAEGADAVVGTVRPDFRDLSPAQVDAWHRTHTPGEANGHVHGANLGIRANVLVAAGGFEPIAVHEDVGLVERARRGGALIVPSDHAWVRTSGRQVGRAPGGYARYLREDLEPLAQGLLTSG
ncbi:glycosyltransferase [Microbacterium koreense]|uniref:4,4'-diaponeurosporenoate glycosyltransferase n=1 Tax=Microbacterium koreense TaxID=323761 RepID=A0ABW2ZPP4_9MICO